MELQAPHRAAQVKNKSAAKIQITAEQILREATERQDKVKAPPAQKFADKEELDDYRLMKRKGYEEFLRSNRTHIPTWLKYAQFEENQFEYERYFYINLVLDLFLNVLFKLKVEIRRYGFDTRKWK